jgi:hypothetical protein
VGQVVLHGAQPGSRTAEGRGEAVLQGGDLAEVPGAAEGAAQAARMRASPCGPGRPGAGGPRRERRPPSGRRRSSPPGRSGWPARGSPPSA